MKKRLISMLLTVLLLVSLFGGYSLSASADTVSYSTMKYTMQSGDYVLRICQRLGLNYYTCKTAIMKLNNINENQWNKLPVGKVLTLPATDADGVVIATGKGSTLTANPVSAAATTTSTATANTTAVNSTKTVTTNSAQDTLIAKDKIVWYLIPYTLAKGESVVDACNALGINFNSYKYAIQRVNNISNWNNIPAGTTLWLASGSAPAGGTNCIAIYRHMMQSGETAYGVVTQRGLNYNSVKWLLEIVNEIYPDLASIKAGQRFDYPISTTIGLTSNQATGGSTTTTTTTNSSGTTVTTVQKYKLTSGIDTGAASVTFYVGSAKVTEAQAGDTVNVEINTKAGRAIKNVVVKYANGQADLQLSSYSFTMPKCDVRIDAEFMKGYAITLESNYVGKAISLVNGVSVNGAATGASVMVSSIDPAYEIESIAAYYKTILGVKKPVTITSSNGFVMPDSDVTVEVKLKPVTTYDFYVTDPDNGSFHLQVNGATVTKAAKGAQVTIVTNPMEGYSPSEIKVVEHDEPHQPVNVLNNTFTMPGFDVDVTVKFDSKGNNIVVVPAQGGTVKALYNEKEVTEAPTGKPVLLEAKNVQEGYTLDKVEVTRISDGLKVSVTKDSKGFTFTMPSGGVIVTPIYKGTEKTLRAIVCIGDAKTPATAYNNVSLHVITDGVEYTVEKDSEDKIKARYGNYVDLKPVEEASIMGFVEYVVEVDGAVDDELTNQANIKGYIQMPDKDVTVKAVFGKGYMNIGAAAISGKGTVSYYLSDYNRSVHACQPGDKVTIVAAPAVNYLLSGKDSITVTRKDTGAKLSLTETTLPNKSTGYTFIIPAEGVNIQVNFTQRSLILTMNTYDTAGKNLTGQSLWQISINGGSGVVENSSTSINIPFGAKISVGMTEAGKSEYKMVKFTINGAEYNFSTTDFAYAFTMNEDTAVVATLESKNPKPTVYNLSITQDITKGVAECVIMESDFAHDEAVVVKSAHAGDEVAIVPAPKAGYMIDENHITITKKDGSVIHPTEELIVKTGKTGYVFKMPADGYKSINVDFYQNPFKLKIKVTDGTNDLTALGLVRIVYANGSYNDVSSADYMGAIPAGETIQALISTPGAESNWIVTDISGVPAITKTPVPPYGFSFVMPESDLELTINITGGDMPVDVNLPSTDKTSHYNLQYYKDEAMTDVQNDLTVKSGEVYYVKIMNPNDVGVLAKLDFEDGTGKKLGSADLSTGKFTVPAEDPHFDIAYSDKNYKLKLETANAPAKCKYTVTVDGYEPVSVEPGKTLVDAGYNANINIVVDAGTVATVDGLDSPTVYLGTNITGHLKPDASVEDGATVVVKLNFQAPQVNVATDDAGVEFHKSADCSDTGFPSGSVDKDSTVYIKGTCSSTLYVKGFNVTDADGTRFVEATNGVASVKASKDITAVTRVTDDKTVSLNLVFKFSDDDTDASGKFTVTGSLTGLKDGDTVTIAAKDSSASIASATADPSGSATWTDPTCTINTSAVENGSTVTVNVEASKTPRSLLDTTAGGTKLEYFDKSGNKITTTSVLDGTEVYVKAQLTDTSRYVTSITIIGTTASSPNSKGQFGPFKVTADLVDSNVAVDAADKAITLAFDYKDGADAKVTLFNGSSSQVAKSSITVTKNGEVKASNISLKTAGSDVFGTVKASNGTVSFEDGRKTAKFNLDFSTLNNGSTVTIEVNVD